MKIAIGADHAGFEFKEQLKEYRLSTRRSKYKRRIWTLGRRFSNRQTNNRSGIVYINRKENKRRNNNQNS